VVSTTEVPTGRMIVDTGVRFPAQSSVRSAIEAASARACYLDARGLAEQLFGEDQYANILQLGAAYQCGTIPLDVAAIERAIELNGTAVERNLLAFRWGRQAVADPAALAAGHPSGPATLAIGHAAESAATRVANAAGVLALVDAPQDGELARLLAVRVPELIAYQGERYAREYAEFVERVRVLEAGPTAVTEAVARNLHKLMAYKDEYEVARLSLGTELTADITARFGEGARYSYRLHPPVFRALGMKRKISLGPWFRPAFRLLHAMRGLRGTRLDPFGYAHVRQVERALVTEYRDAVLRAMSAGAPADHATIVELAELPDLVRGYEHVKLANVATYRERQSELLARLQAPAVSR
jgi:indolepyruvate ferredoxin oxidoreductase